MKNIFIVFIALFSFTFANAQNWVSDVEGKCFCCENSTGSYYNLPATPQITGPTTVECGTNVTYSTTACPGASYQWTVTPAHASSGANTNSFTLLSTVPGNYVVSVTIKCGQKTVTSQIQIIVRDQKCCTADFLIAIKELPGGLFQVNARPTCTSENMHYWFLEEVTGCPTGTSVSGGLSTGLFIPKAGTPTTKWPAASLITADPTGGYGMQYPQLNKGKCYRLYHYFLCCGKWKLQTKCFCLTSIGAGVGAGVQQNELNANPINKEVQFNDLPAPLKQIVGQGQSQK
jgi:hypothetical protein